jgi:dTDP-4-amino-4,6-dideoxygalactose transaminase
MKLAILGGEAPKQIVPISEPTLPDVSTFSRELETIFASRQITNDKWVRRFEEKAAEFIGVPEVVAVSSATAGLILVAKMLALRGKVVLPSFTFPATLHILLWNGLEPVLVDCDPETFNISPKAVEEKIAEGGVAAVVPVYIFGNPPEWGRLEGAIQSAGLASFSDAAHGLGSRLGDRAAGCFGDAEVFSLAPTKVTVAGEGGLIATRNRELARDLRIARNYGNPGDYDCVTAGLNARLSELHALLGCLSLEQTSRHIARRDDLVKRYREALIGLPGIKFQKFEKGASTTHNYFAIRIASETVGLTNRELQAALDANGIRSKIYFYPPLHRQSRFTHLPGLRGEYPNTDRLCEEILCLPLFSHMQDATCDRVVATIHECREHAPEIRAALQSRDGMMAGKGGH